MHAKTIVLALSLLVIAVPADAGFGRVGEDTYRCTVTAGGGATPAPVPNLGFDTERSPHPLPADAAAGGCQASSGLPDAGIVTAIEAADGCQAYADVDPVLPGAEALVREDQPVKEGTALWFYCEAGVVDAENAITVDFSS